MRRTDGREVEWHSFYVGDSKYESTTADKRTRSEPSLRNDARVRNQRRHLKKQMLGELEDEQV
jgi:hypothetical protein